MTEETPSAEPVVELKHTPLHARHVARGARLVAPSRHRFPVQAGASRLERAIRASTDALRTIAMAAAATLDGR